MSARSWNYWAALVFGSLTSTSWVGSACATDAESLIAHHVVLKGTLDEQSTARERVLALHFACVTMHTATKKPIKSVAPPDLPREVSLVQHDLYYADQRVVEEMRYEGYEVDQEDCSVNRSKRHFRQIYSMAGTCQIDVINNVAIGFCGTPMPIPAPPAPQVLPPGRIGTSLRPTGKMRTIAGYACQVYSADGPYHNHICIARPESPFPLLSSGFNIGQPGLVLAKETKPATVNVEATMVSLSERVPAALFKVPDGAKINPGASKR